MSDPSSILRGVPGRARACFAAAKVLMNRVRPFRTILAFCVQGALSGGAGGCFSIRHRQRSLISKNVHIIVKESPGRGGKKAHWPEHGHRSAAVYGGVRKIASFLVVNFCHLSDALLLFRHWHVRGGFWAGGLAGW